MGFLEYYKIYYNNYFSRKFKKLNLQHSSVFLGNDKIRDLYNTGLYYGLVYKITRIKDINGRLINNGPVRIGKTIGTLSNRWSRYKTTAKWKKKMGKKLYNFDLALLKYPEDAFKLEIIDVCHSNEELSTSEEFWTVYYNKEQNQEGFDLSLNKFYNPIIGDKFSYYNSPRVDKYISKDMLESVILSGDYMRMKDLTKKFKMSHKPLETYLEKYFGIRSYTQVKYQLLIPYIMLYMTQGFELKDIPTELERNGINILKNYEDKPHTIRRIIGRTWNAHFKDIRYSYIQSPLLALIKQGKSRVEIAKELGLTYYYGKDTAVDKVSTMCRAIWGKSYLDIKKEYFTPIIANLLVKGYNEVDIAIALDFCKEDDSDYIKYKASLRIINLIIDKFRFQNTADTIQFLKTNYINRQNMKSFYFSIN